MNNDVKNFIKSVQQGKLEEVKEILEKNPKFLNKIYENDYFQRSALMWSVYYSYYDVFEFLINKQANLYIVDKSGNTVLNLLYLTINKYENIKENPFFQYFLDLGENYFTSKEILKLEVYARENLGEEIISFLFDIRENQNEQLRYRVEERYYYLQNRIKKYYQKNFSKTQTLLGKEFNLNDIFVDLVINKEKGGVIQLKDIIDINKSYQRIIIKGESGVGKSTLLKQIALNWSNDKLWNDKFDFIFVLNFKNANLGKFIENDKISTMLIKTLTLYSEASDSLFLSEYTKIIENSAKEGKVLILLDALDEIGDFKETILERLKTSYKFYITTSREYNLGSYEKYFDLDLETIGFSDESINSYIDNFFNSNPSKGSKVKKSIEGKYEIKNILKTPLILEVYCDLFNKNEINLENITITEIYKKVVEVIFDNYLRIEKDNESIAEEQDDIILKLGKISYDAFIKGNNFIEGKHLKEFFENKQEFFKKFILKSGFLRVIGAYNSNLFRNNYEFYHLSFMEYFIALYIAEFGIDELGKFLDNKTINYKNWSNITKFLVGIFSNNKQYSNFLFEHIYSKRNSIDFLKELNSLQVLKSEIVIAILNRNLLFNFNNSKILMLINKLNINLKDKYAWSLLHSATYLNNLEVVKFLIEKWGGVNLSDDYGTPPYILLYIIDPLKWLYYL